MTTDVEIMEALQELYDLDPGLWNKYVDGIVQYTGRRSDFSSRTDIYLGQDGDIKIVRTLIGSTYSCETSVNVDPDLYYEIQQGINERNRERFSQLISEEIAETSDNSADKRADNTSAADQPLKRKKLWRRR